MLVRLEALRDPVDVLLGGDGYKTDPHVERPEHLLVLDRTKVFEDGEHVWDLPAAALDDRTRAVGEDATDIVGQPAPCDVGERVGLGPCQGVGGGRRVDDRWRQQHLRPGPVGAGEGGIEVELVDDEGANQREPVGAEVGAVHPDDHIAHGDCRGVDFVAEVDDSERGPSHVEAVPLQYPWMLCGLPSQQRHVGVIARIGDRLDDGLHPVEIEEADGDVILKRNRGGPGCGQVVADHGEQVVTEALDQAGDACQLGLGADAVGRHHQHRLLVAGWDADSRGEPTETTDNVVGPRCRNPPADAFDQLLCFVEIHAGVTIRRHQARSSTNLASASGTSVGYEPVRQAVQKPAPSTPVASRSRSSSR